MLRGEPKGGGHRSVDAWLSRLWASISLGRGKAPISTGIAAECTPPHQQKPEDMPASHDQL